MSDPFTAIPPPALRASLNFLGDRRRVKILHVFASPGDLWSLDLNIHATTEPELSAAVCEALAALEPGAILPAAPEPAWLEFAGAPFLRIFHIPREPRSILAVVRGEE